MKYGYLIGEFFMKEEVIFPFLDPILCPVRDNKYIPVRRIFCVGANYEAHAKEMGRDPKKEKPFFFSKRFCFAKKAQTLVLLVFKAKSMQSIGILRTSEGFHRRPFVG